jgi:Kef-type K+ transport system membrane component KefB
MAAVFVLLLLSAYATEAIGIHALFGAFVLGVILPHGGRLAEQLRARLEDVVVVLFLPPFFAFMGTRTHIGLVSGAQDWLVCGLILLVATIGKFGGAFAAARTAGMEWRPAAAIGAMMNTRGLMELIVLNLGLDLGVISPTLFTMLVLMTLVTTFSCAPMLNVILGKQGFADAPEMSHVDATTKRAS